MKINWLTVPAILVIALLSGVFTPASAQNPGKVAFTARDGNIYFYNIDHSGLEPVTTDGHMRSSPDSSEIEVEYQSLSWSPDGRKLAALRQQSQPLPDRLEISTLVMVYDLQTRTWQKTTLLEIRRFTWNPAGDALIFSRPVDRWTGKGQPAQPYSGIYQYDLASQRESEILPAKDRPLSFPSFSSTGRYLVSYEVIAMEGLGNFTLYDFQTQNYRVWAPETGFAAASLNWAADDSFVVFDQNTYTPTMDSKIYRSGPTFEDVTAISPAVEGRNFYSPRLSPRQDRVLALSDRIANGAEESGYANIWVFNLDGSGAREVLSPTAPLYFFQWMGDGEHMAFSSGDYRNESIQILDVNSGKIDLLGRGREFAVQPGAAFDSAQATATPLPFVTELPTGEPIAALTATPATVAQASSPTPVPPDQAPTAPGWLRAAPPLLAVLLCGGGLGLLLVVAVMLLVLRKK